MSVIKFTRPHIPFFNNNSEKGNNQDPVIYTVVENFKKETYLCTTNKDSEKYVLKKCSTRSIIKEILLIKVLSTGEWDPELVCDDSENKNYTFAFIRHIIDRIMNHTNTKLIITNDEFNRNHVPEFVDVFNFKENSTQLINDTRLMYVTKFIGDDLIELELGNKNDMCDITKKVIIKKLALILKNLHKLGIAHSDVAFENVCVQVYPGFESNPDCIEVRLIDFGLSVVHPESKISPFLSRYSYYEQILVEPEQETDSLRCKVQKNRFSAGRVATMSEERFRANLEPSTYCAYKDDIFALGIMIVRMFKRTLPLSRRLNDYNFKLTETMIVELLQKISCTDDCIDLVKKMLKPENERITIDEILNHPWLKN